MGHHPSADRPTADVPVLPDRLRTEPFRQLRQLALPEGEFLIAGSAPLYIRGLRDRITDLDVVACGPAWQRALALGATQPAPFEGALTVLLLDGRIEIADRWFTGLFGEPAQLFARSETFGGLRFLSLADTVAWKARLNRPKDRADLARLAAAASTGPSAG